MEKQEATQWLERYVGAWKSNDRNDIAQLFSDDAEYRYHPYDEPLRGRDAIVESWLEEPDPLGTYDARYEPIAIDGDVAVATGTTTYYDDQGSVERIYDNCFVMRFERDGRCREFTEWYQKRP